ncbi:hypothetical protein C8039_06640 [Halogeometricum sp. wsp3]|nr:hypothetical protein C8039_06640 [Halogeometricum sp. wsp3]
MSLRSCHERDVQPWWEILVHDIIQWPKHLDCLLRMGLGVQVVWLETSISDIVGSTQSPAR